MKKSKFLYVVSLIFVTACFIISVQNVNAQKMDRIERERMEGMMKTIKNEIKKNYYDTEFHKIDIEARFDQAGERLKEAGTTGQAMAIIAQVLMDFNDSHLYFLPPSTNLDVEYGWRMKMIGDKGYIITVKPKSDAETKGMKVGDQVLSVEGFRPTRSELWKMMYYYNVLSKRTKLNLTLLSPGDEKPHILEIESKIKQHPKVVTAQSLFTLFTPGGVESDIDRNLFVRTGKIAIWKMPSFAIDPNDVDILIGKIKDSSSLILDLRGNGGGYVDTLESLAGFMFDKDLKIAELKGRKEMDPQKSKTRGSNAYTGKLIVLVDSNSGSAAEIFARLVQLEKRGIILGDASAGAVMQAKQFVGSMSNDAVFYGASITNADVIMSDGSSLEHVGVTPNELILQTGADLANERDPVLARAVELLGGSVKPEQAGKFFQYKWKDDRLIIDLGSN